MNITTTITPADDLAEWLTAVTATAAPERRPALLAEAAASRIGLDLGDDDALPPTCAEWRHGSGWAFDVKARRLPTVPGLSDDDYARAFDAAAEHFWDRADEAAVALGFSGVRQEGRLGGWLLPLTPRGSVGGHVEGYPDYHMSGDRFNVEFAGVPALEPGEGARLEALAHVLAALLAEAVDVFEYTARRLLVVPCTWCEDDDPDAPPSLTVAGLTFCGSGCAHRWSTDEAARLSEAAARDGARLAEVLRACA